MTLFELFITFVDQFTAVVALLVGEAHMVGASFSISGAAPTLNAGRTKSPAEVFGFQRRA